jgi:hypothetical protein
MGEASGHPEIRYLPVAPPNYLSLLATGLRNPTVLAHVLLCQRSPFLSRRSHDGADPCGMRRILDERRLLRGEEDLY